MASKGKATKPASSVKTRIVKQKDHCISFTAADVEWIFDNGTGRVIWNDRAVLKQGLKAKRWMAMRTKSKRPMDFDTGGGEAQTNLGLICQSNLFGNREAYYLKDARWWIPHRMILELGMPYVWIPGLVPFHVTDRSKLRVICPEK